ncbi:GDSL-type esterase/lipase family protein [Chryseobacterium fluminis]|uniref:SGNH/GDSL hydrolase family protein n=1 Tax=Chryseobacterium fluminis TaxID=2983606 RepID=UPI002252AAEB|nr:GDSL-type esterase/lipase family protein [Chryseobacterium sp. MMS21-Ot14]UZT98869.1 GDSL-type esterase/lipase family protein [Chryseobacterium sp. MMS21-Ot14]
MKKTIYGLFFGDSITYGEYDGVFGGWVDILKRYALQKYNEGNSNELILFNLGIGGETTEGLVRRIPHEMAARNSAEGNMVFLGYGANDLAVKDGTQMVHPESFKKNILTALHEAKKYTDDIYLISILPFSKNVDGVVVASGKRRTNEDVLVYNQILTDIALENACSYIDFYKAYSADKEVLLSADGVHPNEKGYGMMAEIAIPIIEKYL